MTSTPKLAAVSNETVRKRRLYEEVAGRLEALIHSGDMREGDLLPTERDLMQRYGVGRPAVREAIFALKKMGLIDVAQGSRARVSSPSSSTVVDLLSGPIRYLMSEKEGVEQFQEARIFFEVGLARHAALHASGDDLAAVQKSLRANERALGDLSNFERTDVAFHHAIASIARNPIFESIHQVMFAWLTEQRRTTLVAPRQQDLALRAHQQIYAAIAARDPDRAERMMRDHLLQVTKMYWKHRGAGHEPVRRDGRVRH